MTEVVPGDVVLLSAGDLIPADGIVLEARDFFVKQALLTGESYPVEKRPGMRPIPPLILQEATNAVFMGTSVVSGTARILVVKTGRRHRHRRDRRQPFPAVGRRRSSSAPAASAC